MMETQTLQNLIQNPEQPPEAGVVVDNLHRVDGYTNRNRTNSRCQRTSNL